MESLLDEKMIFNEKAILSSCEGIRKSNSKIYLPNFHSIQYYTEVPYPQIVGKILDFGLTSRIILKRKINKEKLNTSTEKRYINEILKKSFNDMAEIVINFIFDLFLNGKIENLYDGAVPHPFIEKITYNPWNDFILKSRNFKLNKLKQSLYDNLIQFLELEIKYSPDKETKSQYRQMLQKFKKETQTINIQLIKHIKGIVTYAEFIKDLYVKFFDPPVSKNNYDSEIIPFLEEAA
jgi:hypothetical protein